MHTRLGGSEWLSEFERRVEVEERECNGECGEVDLVEVWSVAIWLHSASIAASRLARTPLAPPWALLAPLAPPWEHGYVCAHRRGPDHSGWGLMCRRLDVPAPLQPQHLQEVQPGPHFSVGARVGGLEERRAKLGRDLHPRRQKPGLAACGLRLLQGTDDAAQPGERDQAPRRPLHAGGVSVAILVSGGHSGCQSNFVHPCCRHEGGSAPLERDMCLIWKKGRRVDFPNYPYSQLGQP